MDDSEQSEESRTITYVGADKLARTIADLAESKNILAEYICEAIQYRSMDKQW